MKVGLVAFGSLQTVTGGNLYDRKLLEHLRRCGDEVQVISIPMQSYARGLLDNVHSGLFRRLAGLHVDVLLEDEVNHPSLLLLNRRLKTRAPFPIVTIAHHLRASEAHPGALRLLYNAIERSYLKGVDGLVYASQATSRAACRLAGLRQPGVIAQPAGDQFSAGITEPQVIDRAHEPGPLRILFTGNLIRRKRVHDLLAVLAGLPGDDYVLEIVGSREMDPHYAGQLEDTVSRRSLAGRVTFWGSLPLDRLKGVYLASQVLAAPSQYEGFGIVYLEGLQCGLPALATRNGGAGEVIRHGENGVLIDPGDLNSIRGYLMEWGQDRNRLAQMSLAALRSVSRFPTWEETGERIREFLIGMTGCKE